MSDLYKIIRELLPHSGWIGAAIIVLALMCLSVIKFGYLKSEIMYVDLEAITILMLVFGLWLVVIGVFWRMIFRG
ncbi:UNVERIFIED_ORG: hypothetical protein LHK14_01340 [Roseateles sp. XES5]|nr:hypothetical protein [Roseateles sp. XES5]